MVAIAATAHPPAVLALAGRCDDLNVHRQLRRLERARARTEREAERRSLAMRPQLPPRVRREACQLETWRKIDIRVADRVCRYCLDAAAQTVDHVIPWSRWGSNDADNLVGCCRECNVHKGDRTPVEAGMVLHWPARLADRAGELETAWALA